MYQEPKQQEDEERSVQEVSSLSLLWCLWLAEEGKEKTMVLPTFEMSWEPITVPICRAALVNTEDLPIKLKFGNVPGCFQGIWGKMFLFLDNENYHISWLQQGSPNWKNVQMCFTKSGHIPNKGNQRNSFQHCSIYMCYRLKRKIFSPVALVYNRKRPC